MYSFETINRDKLDRNEYCNISDKKIYTTPEWLRFLEESQNSEILIIRICSDKKLIGYFTAAAVEKYGIKIIGSPLRGWATLYMGFDLYDNSLITELIEPTVKYIFNTTKCVYFEYIERNLPVENAKKIKYKTNIVKTYEIDLDKTLDDVFRSVKSDCRQFIRQFEKKGARIVVAEPTEIFAEELYDQICDVFSKQDLVPTFSLKKIKILINSLKNTDMLLCLSVINPMGKSIASYISVGYKNIFSGWCIGSLRQFQNYRPNEYLIWYAIKYWHGRGMKIFDFAGEREYKLKWNPIRKEYLSVMVAKYSVLYNIRSIAKKTYWFYNKAMGILEKIKMSYKK